MTRPLAMSGSTKSAGRIGTSPQSGWLTFLSMRLLPGISSFISTVWSCRASFSAASFETIQAFPSTSAFTYVTFGFAQRLVTPWMVSGRRVAVGMNASPNRNMTIVNLITSALSPSSRSWSPTGLSSTVQNRTGWAPLITWPAS